MIQIFKIILWIICIDKVFLYFVWWMKLVTFFFLSIHIYTVYDVLMANILGWFAIPSSSGSRFVRTQPLWPVHLGWPYTARLIASLSYASPFTKTRQWSMKGILYINYLINQETFTDNLLSTIWHQFRQCEEDKEL